MNSGVVVKAGAKFALPVVCTKLGVSIEWNFTVQEAGSDIGFSLVYEPVQKKDNESVSSVVIPQRIESMKGTFFVEGSGTLLFEWDNSFSWLNEKTLDYHVSFMEPVDKATRLRR